MTEQHPNPTVHVFVDKFGIDMCLGERAGKGLGAMVDNQHPGCYQLPTLLIDAQTHDGEWVTITFSAESLQGIDEFLACMWQGLEMLDRLRCRIETEGGNDA